MDRTAAAPAALAVALVLALAGCASQIARVEGDVVAPPPALRVEGAPPVPVRIAAALARYAELAPRGIASWHPVRREIVVSARGASTTQLFAVAAPLQPPRPLTRGGDPVRTGRLLPRHPDVLLFTRDTGGDEQGQVYRLDPGSAEPVRLTDPRRAHRLGGFNRSRDRVLVQSVDLDKTGRREAPGVDLALLDPLDPSRSARVASLPRTGWGSYTFSFDDRRLAALDYRSVAESYVWLIDVASGERRQVFPPPGDARTFASSDLQFARDGAGLFLATDRDGEHRQAGHLDLATGAVDYFGPAGFDTDAIALSPDGRTIALVVNEGGFASLRLYDADTRREKQAPPIPQGRIRRVAWHENSRDLAFDLDSAQSPGDVWSVDVASGEVTRWTAPAAATGANPAAFRSAERIAWPSFDGHRIEGFVVRPPKSFAGRRPVLVSVHGGPEAQARPGFLGRLNYFVEEMGIALVQPNVRGSTGYGKTFAARDDGRLREDAVRDVGALLDWIAAQPDLDPSRVVVSGGSYGGYVSLAVAARYSDRIAGSIDSVGIANFVTFLERTESYRRDLRRAEYGDERDPAMREFLARISPVTNAGAIRRPLLVVHGRNDPRVPYSEAEQIVAAARRNGVPTWFLLADNEGHGFARRENVDYYFGVAAVFLEQTLGR